MSAQTLRLAFPGHSGARLAARLDMPSGTVRAYALFAHCFTCTKDILGAKRLAAALARQGIAVLRFDFTGLGSSEGEFASTNFSSNVQDVVAAAEYLAKNFEAPSFLIGHSLGGAAVLAAKEHIPSVKAVATIGAPVDPEHVLHNISTGLERVEAEGVASVTIGGREFQLQKQFLDDVRASALETAIRHLKCPLLVMHSPLDAIVGVENASAIFMAARHPKSFVSLDTADHLLTKAPDAEFAASVLEGWVSRYLLPVTDHGTLEVAHNVVVSETGAGKFQNTVDMGPFHLLADEPRSVGGLDSGPAPYDLLGASLGACTSMTLRMYSDLKKLNIGKITVTIDHKKIHAKDCADCTAELREVKGKIDQFTRTIQVEGLEDEATIAKLIEIADKCPVHKTLEGKADVKTNWGGNMS